MMGLGICLLEAILLILIFNFMHLFFLPPFFSGGLSRGRRGYQSQASLHVSVRTESGTARQEMAVSTLCSRTVRNYLFQSECPSHDVFAFLVEDLQNLLSILFMQHFRGKPVCGVKHDILRGSFTP